MVLDFGLNLGGGGIFPVSEAVGDGFAPPDAKIIFDDAGLLQQLQTINIPSGEFNYTDAAEQAAGLQFGNGVNRIAHYDVKIPISFNGKRIKISFFWRGLLVNTGNCYWKATLYWGNAGEAYNTHNENTGTDLIDAGIAVADGLQQTPKFTTTGIVYSDDVLKILAQRLGAEVADTFNDTAYLMIIKLEAVD